MARHECIAIQETLTTLLSKAEIERLANESGAVRRRRKIDTSAMLWSVSQGFGTDASGSWWAFAAPMSE